MEDYNIQATQDTPNILGNFKEGTIRISGKCCPADSVKFFQPFLTWLTYFTLSENVNMRVIVDLDAFNTSSALIIFRILKKIKSLSAQRPVRIIWRYDSEDVEMQAIGKDFQYMLGEIIELEARIKKAS